MVIQEGIIDLMDTLTDNQEKTPRWLTEEELSTFREDYRELEKEIQSFFRTYYLSGLILVAAWLTGPQSKPLLELALGNGGYNIYAPIGIALLNLVATISLIYKSISIHEVTQFAALFSKTDSSINYWEGWRRSSHNYAKFVRPFYSPLLFIVPVLLSCLILIPTGRILYIAPLELIRQIKDFQVPSSSDTPVLPTSVPIGGPSSTADGKPVEGYVEAEKRLEDARVAYAARISQVFWWASGWFWIVVGLHIVPVGLAFFNAIVVPRRWIHLKLLRDQNLQFTGSGSITLEADDRPIPEDKANLTLHKTEATKDKAKVSDEKIQEKPKDNKMPQKDK